MVLRMNRKVLYSNKYVTDYEKYVYESCLTKDGIETLMKEIQEKNKNAATVSAN